MFKVENFVPPNIAWHLPDERNINYDHQQRKIREFFHSVTVEVKNYT